MPTVEEFAIYLYEQGFNAVCVSGDKKPLGSWDASKRLGKPPSCREAVAVTGNFFADEQYKVVIFDVDDPNAKIMNEVFGSDWRSYLCGAPWSFCVLTGPRPKHLVECVGDSCTIYEDKEHTKPIRQVKLSELERGIAVVVRIPSKCVKGNLGTIRNPEVEIIYSNYQVVYGRHPSGVFYQPVRWSDGQWVPVDAPGAGVVLSCEEFWRMVGTVRHREEKKEEAEEKTYEPPRAWDREVAKPDVLLALLKRWWPLTREDGSHFHDALTFGVASLAWRYGVKKESIMAVFEKLFKWAVEQGLDTERDVAHHKGVIEWVYSASAERRRWGGKKLREVIAEVLKAESTAEEAAPPTELDVESVLSTIFETLGVKERRPEDVANGVLCITLRWATDGQGNAVAAEWLCNTKGGVIVRKFKKNKKKRRKKDSEKEEGEEEEGNEKSLFDDVLLVDMSISSLTVYSDILTGREYVNADVLVGKIGLARWRMKPRSNFVREVEEVALTRTSPKWRPILNYYPHVYDVIISGFFCPNPDNPHLGKLVCGVRDYFHTGIRDPDKPTARAAFETALSVLDRFAPDNTWYKTAATSWMHGLAQVFFLTRKAWGVRPSFVTLEGPKGLGKSTIGLLTLHTLFPERADDLFVSASGTMTAARLGRLQDEIAAGVAVIDEQKGILDRREVMEVFKSMVTSKVAWKTAWGEKWPAVAGFVLTANKFIVTDPDVADKLYKIQFSGAVDPAKRPDFATAMAKVFNIVGDFGGYYLHYAERSWATVKDAILAPTQAEAAERYARIVADELGVSIELVPVSDITAVSAAVTPSDIFRDLIWRELKQQMAAIRDGADAISAKHAFNVLLDKGRLPFMRKYSGDETKIMILKNIELYNGELSLRSLCEELGGELYTKSRNKLYYGACIVDGLKVEDVLFPEDAPEEEGGA
ncbi:MAG: hypothetical protein ACO2PM_18805 [Pyrobaculum sp.]|jgi:hypothetical protein